MERDKVIELAEKCGLAKTGGNCVDGVFLNAGDCQDELYSLVALVEKETLERAAKVCDDASEFAITSAQESSFIYCATKIRNLKINDQ